jgi:hypothetical protein
MILILEIAVGVLVGLLLYQYHRKIAVWATVAFIWAAVIVFYLIVLGVALALTWFIVRIVLRPAVQPYVDRFFLVGISVVLIFLLYAFLLEPFIRKRRGRLNGRSQILPKVP